jgi:hypothetical protein
MYENHKTDEDDPTSRPYQLRDYDNEDVPARVGESR